MLFCLRVISCSWKKKKKKKHETKRLGVKTKLQWNQRIQKEGWQKKLRRNENKTIK